VDAILLPRAGTPLREYFLTGAVDNTGKMIDFASQGTPYRLRACDYRRIAYRFWHLR
jgi:hypothetical protein